jgi:ketosteroid isomerase-like protein
MPLTITSRPAASTTTDDVTTLRRFFAAWTSGDLAAMLALVDRHVVVEPLIGVLYAREVYLGRSGIAGAVREVTQRWHHFEITVEDAVQEHDQVIAHVHLAVEKHGMSCEGHVTVVCTLRDGLIVSLAGDDAE